MADKRISQLVERVDIANNDVVPIVASGATTTNKATISSIQTFMQENLDVGVTSVGITIGTSGTDVNVTGSPVTTSGNITINIPTASATNRGLLSAADWITFNSKQDAGSFVTLDTAQTITAQKTFTTSGSSDTMIISHGSGSGFALDVLKAGNNEALRVTKTSGSGNAMTVIGGNFEAPTIVKTGGTSSQFLKADGSVDSSTYLTTGSATSTYVPYSGAAASVNLGVYSITANAINSAGSGSTAGQINLRSDAFFSLVNGYGSIASGTTNQFNLYQTTGAGVFRGAILSLNSITESATRTYTLPNADGTLALSTDLGAYLPLTGGTLTGALNGTSASFTGAGSFISTANTYAGGALILRQLGGTNPIYLTSVGGSFALSNGGSADHFLIASTGAATFSSRINGVVGGTAYNTAGLWLQGSSSTDGIAIGGTGGGDKTIDTYGGTLKINSTSGNGLSVTGAATFSSDLILPYNKALAFNTTSNQYISADSSFLYMGAGNVWRLKLDASTGAATFSSSVTALNLDLKGTATVQGNTFAPIEFYNSGNIAAAIRPIRYNDETAADLTFCTRAYLGSITERMRLTSDAYLRMAASSGGIQFNGDTAAANALDDYEEGTFTPSFVGTGLTINTYGNRAGFYTKVGRLVTVTINMMTESVSVVGSEAVKIGGLPFTSNSTPESANAANIFNSARWTANPPINADVTLNSTEINLYTDRGPVGAGTDPTTVKSGDMATGSGNRNMVRLTATYFTS